MSCEFGFEPTSIQPYYFISYNSQDADRVAEICRELNRRDVPVWYDKGLMSGDRWEKQIAEQVKNCHEMIIFITKNLMKREDPFVYKEYVFARRFQKRIHVIMMDRIEFEDVSDDLKSWFVDIEAVQGLRLPSDISAQQAADAMNGMIHFVSKSDSVPIPGAVTSVGQTYNKEKKSSSTKSIVLICTAMILLTVSACAGIWMLLGRGNKSDSEASADVSSEYVYDDYTCYAYEYDENTDTYAITGLVDESLTVLRIPETISGKPVTVIANKAFKDCVDITEITIPSTVTRIRITAFERCINLGRINVQEGNDFYVSEDGVLYDIDKTELILFPPMYKAGTVTFPSTVTKICNGAFMYNQFLKRVTIPSTVTEIEGAAFYNSSSLIEIEIPDSVERIGEFAFAGCNALKRINIPSSVTVIPDGVFGNCSSLTEITIPSSVVAIYDYVFEDCTSLRNVSIPPSVEIIGSCAFKGCVNLTKITIPASVTEFRDKIFQDCDNVTIYCEAGSAAEQYAKENDIPFVTE